MLARLWKDPVETDGHRQLVMPIESMNNLIDKATDAVLVIIGILVLVGLVATGSLSLEEPMTNSHI